MNVFYDNGDYLYSWDDNKEKKNRRKHWVTFKEAITVFDDDDALYKSDPDHSQDEERFIIIGRSARDNLLVVCHCYRENDAVIRIISARKATSMESIEYGGRL